MDDCNDETERAPSECRDVLILSEEESQCGSKCKEDTNEKLARSSQKRQKWWTLWTSIDTAATGTGDHENYFVRLNLADYLRKHDHALLNANCESIAVRIRDVSNQRLWPNIPLTTLLFSNTSTYYSPDYLDQIGDIQIFKFHQTVKPNYG